MRKLICSKEAKIGEIGEKAAFSDSSQKNGFMQIAAKMEEKKVFNCFPSKRKKGGRFQFVSFGNKKNGFVAFSQFLSLFRRNECSKRISDLFESSFAK